VLAIASLPVGKDENKAAVQLALHRRLQSTLPRPQAGKGFPFVSGKNGTTIKPRM
jgi:hypothetical protein